jgi:hypothetical protein
MYDHLIKNAANKEISLLRKLLIRGLIGGGAGLVQGGLANRLYERPKDKFLRDSLVGLGLGSSIGTGIGALEYYLLDKSNVDNQLKY